VRQGFRVAVLAVCRLRITLLGLLQAGAGVQVLYAFSPLFLLPLSSANGEPYPLGAGGANFASIPVQSG
jgi:hypothetical protein